VAVRDDDTPDALSERILAIEHRIYPEALRLLASGKLRLDGAVCRLDGDACSSGTLISPHMHR
jgi:phosphoribosylglycinamide formyltransferase-1